MKNELRNLGLFLITPFPQKYHFEGVNNTRSARQLAAIIGVTYVGAAACYVFQEAIMDTTTKVKTKLQSLKNK